MRKTCRRCLTEMPIEQFYKHKTMFDGHLNVCINCTKKRVKKYSQTEIGKLVEKRRQQSEKRKEWVRNFTQKQYAKFPEKRKARIITDNAMRDGRLVRKPCEVCNEIKGEAHHDDYTKPLLVRWLCIKHHKELRKNHA